MMEWRLALIIKLQTSAIFNADEETQQEQLKLSLLQQPPITHLHFHYSLMPI